MIYKMVPASISSPLAQFPSPVEAGSQFNVTCEAEPKKATVTWTKNGQAVTGNDRVKGYLWVWCISIALMAKALACTLVTLLKAVIYRHFCRCDSLID